MKANGSWAGSDRFWFVRNSDLFGIQSSLANFLVERQGNRVKFMGCSKC